VQHSSDSCQSDTFLSSRLDWFAHELLLLLPCLLPKLAHQVAASAVWFQTVKLCVVLPRILSTSLT
jgi:hypothetical protein